MADNPYTGILGIMQEQGARFNPPSICLGEVVSPEPDLKIKTEDLILDKDDFLISDSLINNYLISGDIVALIPTANRQQYIVLCKVVSL